MRDEQRTFDAMFRGVVGVMLVLSCSSPGSRDDAGSVGDGGPDAVACTGDRDGDGHCDELDVCPDVADPMQVDYDGDHVGWACDPVESVRFDSNGSQGVVPFGWINRDGAAAAAFPTQGLPLGYKYAAIAVSGVGKMVSNPDSADSTEKWVTGPFINGPIVADDGQILFSWNDGNGAGLTYAVDVASRTSLTRGPVTMIDLVQDATGRAVAMQTQGNSYDLVEPRGGTELHKVATAPTGQYFWGDGHVTFAPKRVASDPAMFVATKSLSGVPAGLQMFYPGANSLAPLPVPAAAGSVSFRPADEPFGTPTYYFTNISAPWCVENNASSVRVWQWPMTGIESVFLPVSSCFMYWTTVANTQFYFSSGPDLDGDGDRGQSLMFRRAGTVHEIARDIPAPLSARLNNIHGTDQLFTIEANNTFNVTTPGKVWAVLPDNSVQLLSSDLSAVHTSVAGQVVHIVGLGTGAQDGQWIARRWRPGMAIQSVVLPNSGPTEPRVVTSAEGAAIVSFGDNVYIAPSGNFTFTRNFDLREADGGVRGTNTLIVTGIGQNTSAVGGAYAYDEVGGQPRFTPLGAMGDLPQYVMFDTPAGPTEYFSFTSQGTCKVGRIVRNGAGVPTLDALTCFGTASKYRVLGVGRDGAPIVGEVDSQVESHDLYRIGAVGPRMLAATGRVVPIADVSYKPSLIVGWTALGGGPEGLVCLDENPVRCWAVPSAAKVLHTRLENAAGPGPARVNQLLYDRSGMTNRFTIVRTPN